MTNFRIAWTTDRTCWRPSKRWKFLSFVSVTLLFQVGITMVSIAETCAQNTLLVGQCFTVHGRLRYMPICAPIFGRSEPIACLGSQVQGEQSSCRQRLSTSLP